MLCALAACSDLHLRWNAHLQYIDALVDLTLTWHLLSTHQLGALGHVRILHHGRHGVHLVSLGEVCDPTLLALADISLTLDDYIVVTLWCMPYRPN
jgi:hypothetical protein